MPKLIEFPEQTVVIAKDQPEYLPLPAYQFGDERGTIICKWKFSAEELAEIIANNGVVWHEIQTFNQPLQPQMLHALKPEMPVRT